MGADRDRVPSGRLQVHQVDRALVARNAVRIRDPFGLDFGLVLHLEVRYRTADRFPRAERQLRGGRIEPDEGVERRW